jgi:antibiotic biosynthesis monooxygenase (ABM) superfamily enzyme
MIKHIVFFKLAPFAEGNTKQENALYLKEKLENLQSIIPGLLKMEVFINIPDVAADNYDLVLMAEFNNLQDLDVYINHPEHVKVASFITKVRTDRAAIDYKF